MPTVKVIDDDKEINIKVTQGEFLGKYLKDNNLDISFNCRSNGRCGKCLVKIIEGNADISSTDEKKLSIEQQKEGLRASCRLAVRDNLTIKVFKK